MNQSSKDISTKIRQSYLSRHKKFRPRNQFELEIVALLDPLLESMPRKSYTKKPRGIDTQIKRLILKHIENKRSPNPQFITIDQAEIEFEKTRAEITKAVEGGYILTKKNPNAKARVKTWVCKDDLRNYFLFPENMFLALQEAGMYEERVNPVTKQKYTERIFLDQSKLGKSKTEVLWEELARARDELNEVFGNEDKSD